MLASRARITGGVLVFFAGAMVGCNGDDSGGQGTLDGSVPDAASPDASQGTDAGTLEGSVAEGGNADATTGEDGTSPDAPAADASGDAQSDATIPPDGSALDAGGDALPETGGDAPAEASLDAGVPDGACNALTTVGVPAPLQVASTAAVPAALAGNIVDGTYYLVQTTLYEQDGGATASGNPLVWVISGGGTHIEFAGVGSDGGASTGAYDMYPVDAGDAYCTQNCIGVNVTCVNGMPSMMPGEWPYSAVQSDAGVEWSFIPNSNPLVWMTFRKQ
jgi:hypothetical protein